MRFLIKKYKEYVDYYLFLKSLDLGSLGEANFINFL